MYRRVAPSVFGKFGCMQLWSETVCNLRAAFCRLGIEGFRELLPEVGGASGAELLLEDEEGEEASRQVEDAANIAQAVAAALAADSGLRKALLQVSQSAAIVPLPWRLWPIHQIFRK